jgi:hypothetical protein
VELEEAVTLTGFEPHGPGSVPQGVLDEVPKRLLEPPPVGEHLEARGNNDLDLALRIGRAPAEPCRNRVEQLSHGNVRSAQRQRSGVDAREQEQIVGELRKPVGLLPRRAKRRDELGRRRMVGKRELDLRLHQRERRAELVACVGHQRSLAF